MNAFATSRLRDAIRRIRTALRPNVTVTAPPTTGMRVDWNVPVTVRDGTALRANVFRPTEGGPFPVILCAHPYDKDAIGVRGRGGKALNFQYRLFPQPHPITFSALTSWEAPDPVVWVALGFAVVNADLRGGGQSEGIGELLSDQEAEDYYDLIEWAGHQSWSTGRVGLNGVSYLAISQYKVAALQPPSLAALCPWEGFSDLYRDFARPGGILERGFLKIWSTGTAKAARIAGDLFADVQARPERDDWYVARTPILERIRAPILVCASFSDQSLHTRGSFEVFRRAGSASKWLYTHRGGKWSTYYGRDAVMTQARFFAHFLRGDANGWQHEPTVRLAVHEAGPNPVAVYAETDWPPRDLTWIDLSLDASRMTLRTNADPGDAVPFATVDVRLPRETVSFDWIVPQDLEIIGPLALTLPIRIAGGGDVSLFAGVRKLDARGRQVGFEGSFGYASDMVTKGWQRAAHRDLDPVLSADAMPVHTHERFQPLAEGELVTVRIALLPQATLFRAGDRLRLDIRGAWYFATDPLRGQFPANYQPSREALCTIHTGAATPAVLRLGWRAFSGGSSHHAPPGPAR